MTKNKEIYNVTYKKMEINNPHKTEYNEDVYHESFYAALAKSQAQYEERFKLDSIVQSVVDKFNSRAKIGKEKYNKTLDRTDLSALDWINHAQEELMDGILYLEKLKQTLGGK
jgi:hypothetical protein